MKYSKRKKNSLHHARNREQLYKSIVPRILSGKVLVSSSLRVFFASCGNTTVPLYVRNEEELMKAYEAHVATHEMNEHPIMLWETWLQAWKEWNSLTIWKKSLEEEKEIEKIDRKIDKLRAKSKAIKKLGERRKDKIKRAFLVSASRAKRKPSAQASTRAQPSSGDDPGGDPDPDSDPSSPTCDLSRRCGEAVHVSHYLQEILSRLHLQVTFGISFISRRPVQ